MSDTRLAVTAIDAPRSGRRSARRLDRAVPGIAGFLFATAVFVPGHLFNWLVEWLWLALAAGTSFVACFFSRAPLRGPCDLGMPAWLGGHAIVQGILVSGAVYALLAHSSPMGQRDAVELIRLPLYGLFGLFIGTLSTQADRKLVDGVLRAMVLLLCIGAFVILARVPVLHSLVYALYADAKTQIGFGIYRFSMPFQNPNFLAFVLLPTLAYFLFYRVSLLFSLLTIAGLALTGSRSGWIGALPVILAAYFYWLTTSVWKARLSRASLLLLLPVILVGIALANLEELRTLQRFAELLDALEGGGVSGVQTAAIRLSGGARLIEDYVTVSPLIGWGPGRGLGIDVADNQYISWVLMYGMLGATVLVLLLGAMLLQLVVASRSARHLVGAASLACALGAILMTGDFLENYRLYFFTAFLIHTIYLEVRDDGGASAQTSREGMP